MGTAVTILPTDWPPPGVALLGASLRFGGTTLFADLTANFAPGSWTALLGPSGVGKSSLLRLIAGLAPPGTTGTVRASDGAPLAPRVALMEQKDHLLPWATVLDNVLIGSRLRGERPDPVRARHLLGRLGLGDAAGLRPAALSGGMRQRTALARTLYEQRPVVLMDEPFSALDAPTRHRLQNEAAALLRGTTVVLVTHDPLEALRLADRILVLSGRPVRLEDVPVPPGAPPRPVGAPGIAAAQERLLATLTDSVA